MSGSEPISFERKVKEVIKTKRLKTSLNRGLGIELPPVYGSKPQICGPKTPTENINSSQIGLLYKNTEKGLKGEPSL